MTRRRPAITTLAPHAPASPPPLTPPLHPPPPPPPPRRHRCAVRSRASTCIIAPPRRRCRTPRPTTTFPFDSDVEIGPRDRPRGRLFGAALHRKSRFWFFFFEFSFFAPLGRCLFYLLLFFFPNSVDVSTINAKRIDEYHKSLYAVYTRHVSAQRFLLFTAYRRLLSVRTFSSHTIIFFYFFL